MLLQNPFELAASATQKLAEQLTLEPESILTKAAQVVTPMQTKAAQASAPMQTMAATTSSPMQKMATPGSGQKPGVIKVPIFEPATSISGKKTPTQ